MSTADCIPVLLYDEEHHAAAAVHAGWRGTLARIVGKTIADMSIAYKTDPKKLKAVIGPGISRKNFEVGDEVYAAFEEAAFDMPTLAQQEIKRNPDAADPSKLFEKKWHIDLKLANRQLLEQAGVADENILESDVCTYDSVDVLGTTPRHRVGTHLFGHYIIVRAEQYGHARRTIQTSAPVGARNF